jgi:hypothetical protein
MEDENDEDLTYLTFVNTKMKMVCIFCAEVILARNNSGYIRSFIAYKAQKLLIISKNTFINVIFG